MKIVWSPLAIEKMSDISDYIALDNPLAALNWVETVFEEVEKLSQFPDSGRIVPELKNNQYRELVIGSYRVIYKNSAGQIQILTVRSFRQLLSQEHLNSNPD